jgi:hypothetical protein
MSAYVGHCGLTFKVEHLRGFEAIFEKDFRILVREEGGCFDEKFSEERISCYSPFRQHNYKLTSLQIWRFCNWYTFKFLSFVIFASFIS